MNIQLKCTGASYSFNIYTKEDIDVLLINLKNRINNDEIYKKILRHCGFKKTYIDIVDQLYYIIMDYKKFNDTFNKEGVTTILNAKNETMCSATCQLAHKLYNRNTLNFKATNSIYSLYECLDKLNYYNIEIYKNKICWCENE